MHRMSFLVATGLTLAGISVHAEPQAYAFDPAHSRLFFDYVHQGYSVMLGRFTEFDGEFLFDPENPAASSLDVVIAADSVDVFDAELTPRLRGEEFFDAARFPEIRFVSRAVAPIGDERLRVDGDITMLGVTRPMSIEVVQNRLGVNRQGLMVAGFSATGQLDRRDFGMDFLAEVAGGDIAVRVEVEASPAPD